ncbi:YceI-like domain protein [compost metagenome]
MLFFYLCSMKILVKIALLYLLVSVPIFAQPLVNVSLQKNSSLIITGTTNVVSFKIFQNGEDLSNKKLSFTTSQNQNKISLSENKLSVAVKNFSSHNKMALRDFLKLIKSDTYPNMQVQINYLDLQPSLEKNQPNSMNAIVSITITGVKRHYSIPVSYSSDGDLYFIKGKKKLSIRDFGLTPVSQMMGLIKVSEWIDIDFNMICKIKVTDTEEI